MIYFGIGVYGHGACGPVFATTPSVAIVIKNLEPGKQRTVMPIKCPHCDGLLEFDFQVRLMKKPAIQNVVPAQTALPPAPDVAVLPPLSPPSLEVVAQSALPGEVPPLPPPPLEEVAPSAPARRVVQPVFLAAQSKARPRVPPVLGIAGLRTPPRAPMAAQSPASMDPDPSAGKRKRGFLPPPPGYAAASSGAGWQPAHGPLQAGLLAPLPCPLPAGQLPPKPAPSPPAADEFGAESSDDGADDDDDIIRLGVASSDDGENGPYDKAEDDPVASQEEAEQAIDDADDEARDNDEPAEPTPPWHHRKKQKKRSRK